MHGEKFGKIRVVISGCRDFMEVPFVIKKLDFFLSKLPKDRLILVFGDAPGVDNIAWAYAILRGYDYQRFPADWKHFGHSAGPVRNELMADFSTHLLAFWDGKSPGTGDMIEKAKKYDLDIRIVDIKNAVVNA
jgi:hypothetical protein